MEDPMGTYLRFVEERHAIWEKRQAGEPGPWTDDPILTSRKFTNVFRVLDPGSQFVLTDVLADDPEPLDALARLMLYRNTNIPSVWDIVVSELGGWPGADDLVDVAAMLHEAEARGHKITNGAYIIHPGSVRGANIIDAVVDRVWRTITAVGEEYFRDDDLERRVRVLSKVRGTGEFIAMQVSTDYNYGPRGRDAENEYVLAGPGCVRGAGVVCPELSAGAVIELCAAAVRDLGTVYLEGRPPSLMDIQNTLCEFSKYARYLKQEPKPRPAYRPAHPGPQPVPVLPAHWKEGTER